MAGVRQKLLICSHLELPHAQNVPHHVFQPAQCYLPSVEYGPAILSQLTCMSKFTPTSPATPLIPCAHLMDGPRLTCAIRRAHAIHSHSHSRPAWGAWQPTAAALQAPPAAERGCTPKCTGKAEFWQLTPGLAVSLASSPRLFYRRDVSDAIKTPSPEPTPSFRPSQLSGTATS